VEDLQNYCGSINLYGHLNSVAVPDLKVHVARHVVDIIL